MKYLELRRFDMCKEVRDFCKLRIDAFVTGTYSYNLFNTMTGKVTELENLFQAQLAQQRNAKGGTVGKAAARAALHVELKAISNTAEIVDRDMPGLGINEKFFLPKRLKAQELLNIAHVIADTAALYEKEFIKHAMAADFLAQLNDHIAVLETDQDISSHAEKARIAATAAIDDLIDQCMDLIERLDVVVYNQFHNDKLIMQAWENAKHVKRARSSSPESEPEPSEPVPSQSKSSEPEPSGAN